MRKKLLSLVFCGVAFQSVYANLEALETSDLAEVTGQAGADLSWKLQLNHTPTGNFDSSLCADLRYCRLAMSVNNRYLKQNGSLWQADDASGNKLWIVFKGIQGTLNFQKIGLDGYNLTYLQKGSTNTNINKPAIQLTYESSKPILIRNLGFQSLSVERDSHENEASANFTPGYLNSSNYAAAQTFDGRHPTNISGNPLGRETGFVGINMHGNLALGAKVHMFGCDSTHPRC